jgi:LuxR family transcriptional regulator, quorum-sensing system regulator BjaR1
LQYSVTDAINDIADAPAVQAAIDCFRKFVEQFHVDTFSSGEIDIVNRKRMVFHAMEWSADWRNFYFKSGMVEHDPILQALAHERAAFTWMELRQKREFSVADSEVLNRVALAGWTDGLVVPIHRGLHHFGLVNLVTKGHDLTPDDKRPLTPVALVFQAQLRMLVPREGFRIPPAGLTARELECVRLIADGLSDIKAGDMLGIGGANVHQLAERAKRKLGAGNRAELVALACGFGII